MPSVIDEGMQNRLKTLHQMQQLGERCDVTLVSAGGEHFKAHAGILAAASSLLKQELAKCKPGYYNIVTSFSGREISVLIHYAYTGDTTDPLLSSFTDMGLLCDTNDLLSHAAAILSLLHHFSQRGVFCNLNFHSTQGDTESGHAYLLAANCPTLSQHITNRSRVNLHLALPVPDSSDLLEKFVSITYCLGLISNEYERNTKDMQLLTKLFQCSKCDSVFRSKHAFINHQFHHLNTKPTLYKCNLCNRVFSYNQYLMIHIRSHQHMVLKNCLTAQHILNTLFRMQQTGDLCDLTLVSSDGEQFVAHAGILAAASSLLKQELAECLPGNYNIVTTFIGREISALILYAYTGDNTDPLLSSFTDMGLLCDTNGLLSHAAAILSLLNDFSQRGVFCNLYFHSTQGDTESGHAYLLAANCPTLSQHITNQSRVNLHLELPVQDWCNSQNEFVAIIYCFHSINKEYVRHLFVDLKSSNTNVRTIFKCGKCSNVFRKKTDFIKDQFSHIDTKLALYTCSTCERLFSCHKHLMIHELSHIIPPQHICDICRKKFKSKKGCLAHTRAIHEKTHISQLSRIGFICDTCGKTFKTRSNLRSHIKSHSDYRPFVCDICDKSFKTSTDHKKHQLFHKDEKNNMCDKCGKTFKASHILHRHRLIHTGLKPYACDYCNKRFNQKPNLKTHQLVHTREKSHVCETCGVSYGYKSMLKKHLLSHDKCHT